jgi:hypothetical protein
MKSRISATWLVALLCTITGDLHASATDERQAMGKCTKHPCPNTQSGEDASVIEAREGEKIEARLRANPNDKERWYNIILFSSSTEKQQLSVPIVMEAKLNMTLNPDKGLLTFSAPNASQSFRISEASQEPNSNNPCPKYQIRVIEGSVDYALIKKTCPRYEYRPQKFYRATAYYLYDQKTNTMRTIWSASTQLDTVTPFPTAKPEIVLKPLKDGYRLDWTGLLPSDNPPVSMIVHNVYKREADKTGKLSLVCYDATNPQHSQKEDGMCESDILQGTK